MADGVDAAVEGGEPAGPDAAVDLLRRQPQLEQLTARDHPALLGRELGDREVDPSKVAFASIVDVFSTFDGHARMVGQPPGAALPPSVTEGRRNGRLS